MHTIQSCNAAKSRTLYVIVHTRRALGETLGNSDHMVAQRVVPPIEPRAGRCPPPPHDFLGRKRRYFYLLLLGGVWLSMRLRLSKTLGPVVITALLYDDSIFYNRFLFQSVVATLGEGYHNYHHTFPQDYRYTTSLGWPGGGGGN